MPLVQQNRWAPSQRPYAIDRNTARIDRGGWTVNALWVGRKRGATTITTGTLHLFTAALTTPNPAATLDDALATADMRYGGDWAHQWDGQRLLVNPNDHLTPAQVAEFYDWLDARLAALPAVPVGYEGWYYRQDTP